MESELSVLRCICEKALLAGGHIIESNHTVAGGKQSIDHATANKSSRTCNENPQSNLRLNKII